MIISTFEFNESVIRQGKITNRDFIHKMIMTMYQGNREQENVLYMVMDKKLIVQSNSAPDVSRVAMKLLNSGNCDALKSRIENGNVLKLYAVLEPTKKKKSEGKKWSMDVGIQDEEERKLWVKRKMKEAGAAVSAVNELEKTNVSIEKKDGNKRKGVFYGYEILVSVQDKENFFAALKKGIGRSKAYGAGLCLVVGGANV